MKNEIKTMRDAFIEKVYNCMYKDKDIFFLSADFGAPKLDKIREQFQERFINVGIAEQNLINISTGLALEGFTVYAYAIAPFLTMRPYEQIRNLSLLLQIKKDNVNLNLIGIGAGLSYDVSGPTHHCLEDISIIRTLPNFTVFSPSDWSMAEKFVDYSIKVKKPKYLRFDGKPLPKIYSSFESADLEKGFYELARGDRLCIVSTGYMTHKALKVANELLNNKIDVGVIDMFILKPINEDLLFDFLKNYQYIITLEEGFINCGGLDSLIANILTNKNSKIILKRMGFKDRYVFEMGNREYLHKQVGLDERNILKTIKEVLA